MEIENSKQVEIMKSMFIQNEGKRLGEVSKYNLEGFDAEEKGLLSITNLSKVVCNTTMSFISVVGEEYIDFISRVGSSMKGVKRENSFCGLAVEQDDLFEIPDSFIDHRFDDNIFRNNKEAPLRFYAGYPLKNQNGYNIGVLCVCDSKVGKLDENQKLVLKTLADQVVVHLELRKQNKLLEEAIHKADKLSKAKDIFFSNMSHELRTPLNAISGYADVISKTKLDSHQKDAIEIIKSSSHILITLINDILDFSKIESGKLNIEHAPFNLKREIKNIKVLLNKQAEMKQDMLSLNIDSHIPDIVMGDKLRLIQIIVNLVGNAIKFTDKGHINVDIKLLSESSEQVLINFAVRDTGIGIPPDKFDTIFQRYEQAEKDTTRKFGGTGLGLNISKNLIELQGGTIQLKSKLGEGSEFSFSINYNKPRKQDLSTFKSSPENRSNLEKKLNTLKNIRVLVCEDNPIKIKLIENLLKNRVKSLVFAENGLIAIDIIKNNKEFDFILMDIQMPEKDGIQTTKYIRNEMSLSIPIIGFTANSSLSEKNECIQIGMDDYVTKTFVFEEFFENLIEIMKNIESKKKGKYFPHILNKNNNNDNKENIFVGDWGLGIGDWGLGPIPNPQSPIPNPQIENENDQ